MSLDLQAGTSAPPGGSRFTFTVFDDTDEATVTNIAPVYRLLEELGMRTTKSVWVYPSRGVIGGSTIQDSDYLAFVKMLRDRGFEICMHGVGDGSFTREEILAGFIAFERAFGFVPRLHANHSRNIDNLHWGSERFVWPVRQLFRFLDRKVGTDGSQGHVPGSPHYWGDFAARHIDYVRNLVFNGTNTLACDPRMPYPLRGTEGCVRRWFSSSDGHTVGEFCRLIHPRNVDRLERAGGTCIAYTHFAEGFVLSDGRLHPVFEQRLRALAARPGWFVPVSVVLDHLANLQQTEEALGYLYLLRINLRWALNRFVKILRSRR
jgi:hypothetical protein